jgi:transcription initiation factor IIE alpha subunit
MGRGPRLAVELPLKVLLYIIRRTFGFKKERDNISLSQLLHGITTAAGTVLDRGTGLSKKTLLDTIKNLVEKNLIISERRRSEEKGNEPTTYHLNMIGEKKEGNTTPLV